ncbi:MULTISPECIES: hypothetical protein [Gordonia]|uniref:hypothetical protein n=1 Tax=Gordonia TaxID=2053 RepID=UPI0032B3650A
MTAKQTGVRSSHEGSTQSGFTQAGSPRRRRLGFVVGLTLGAAVVLVVVGSVWVVVTHRDQGDAGPSDADYVAFARTFAVDVATVTGGDVSQPRAALTRTCEGSPARGQLQANITDTENAITNSPNLTTKPVGTPEATIDTARRTDTEVPLDLTMTVAISDYVGEPTTTTREFLITLRPGTTPCVWNVAGV